MTRARLAVGMAVLAASGLLLLWPYAEAFALIARVADLPGGARRFAEWEGGAFTVDEPMAIPTRHGAVPARLYRPDGPARLAVTLVPGAHMDGIDETRLVGMAQDLARTGYTVLTVAPPDLRRFRITPENTDIIEDAATWLSMQRDLAPGGHIGMFGISFSGGLSIVAAGRPGLRDRVSVVLSFGGHGDLLRVMRYLCSGKSAYETGSAASYDAPPTVTGAEHVTFSPPHDYGVAVVLLTLTDRVVPADQVQPLQHGITTFLTASSLTLIDQRRADERFAEARAYALSLPEPARTLMGYVNDRDVTELGRILLPAVESVASESSQPSLSPERSRAPQARVMLLHGADDNVIPSSETISLAKYLTGQTQVRALLSGLITHAEVDRDSSLADAWHLSAFWRDLMRE